MQATLAAHDVLAIGFSGIPMLAVSPDSTSASKNLDAASATVINRFFDVVRGTSLPLVDAYAALSGSVDADGQVTAAIGMLTDGMHPSDAGHAAIAEVLVQRLQNLALV